MVLNKSLQVGILMVCVAKLNAELIKTTGDQRAKYECRACGTDVQELPVKRVVPSGRSVHQTTHYNDAGYPLLSHVELLH